VRCLVYEIIRNISFDFFESLSRIYLRSQFKPSFSVLNQNALSLWADSGCILDALLLCIWFGFLPSLPILLPSSLSTCPSKTASLLPQLMSLTGVFGVEMCPLDLQSAVVSAISVQQETKRCPMCDKVWWVNISPS